MKQAQVSKGESLFTKYCKPKINYVLFKIPGLFLISLPVIANFVRTMDIVTSIVHKIDIQNGSLSFIKAPATINIINYVKFI